MYLDHLQDLFQFLWYGLMLIVVYVNLRSSKLTWFRVIKCLRIQALAFYQSVQMLTTEYKFSVHRPCLFCRGLYSPVCWCQGQSRLWTNKWTLALFWLDFMPNQGIKISTQLDASWPLAFTDGAFRTLWKPIHRFLSGSNPWSVPFKPWAAWYFQGKWFQCIIRPFPFEFNSSK